MPPNPYYSGPHYSGADVMEDGASPAGGEGRAVGLALALGLAVERFRTEQHLSLAQLAGRAKMTEAELEAIESGVGRMRAQDLAALSTALGVRPIAFFRFVAV